MLYAKQQPSSSPSKGLVESKKSLYLRYTVEGRRQYSNVGLVADYFLHALIIILGSDGG